MYQPNRIFELYPGEPVGIVHHSVEVMSDELSYNFTLLPDLYEAMTADEKQVIA